MIENKVESEGSQETTGQEEVEKPGALLKQARERQGLTVEEVAKTLYLTRTKLRHLEGDEYDKLQSHVFIKGYLRKYAPVVGLDAEHLVELYQKISNQISEAMDQLDDKDEDIPNTLIPKFVVPAALFGIAAAILITIFVFVGDDDTNKAPLTPASEIDSELAERVQARSMEQQEPEPNLDRELAAEVRENTETVGVASNETPAPTEIRPNVVANNTPSVAARPNSQTANDGPDLRFEFSEDCWLEVRDQFDTIIYTDVAKAGESLELQGEPPFSMTLGNAQAVTLYWGDQLIDTSPRPGNRTAKLTVGETVTQ